MRVNKWNAALVKVRTHNQQIKTLAVPAVPSTSLALVLTIAGTAFESEHMKENKQRLDWTTSGTQPLKVFCGSVEVCECMSQVAASLIASDHNLISELTLQRDAMRELLIDIHAFVIHALDHDMEAGTICATIGHDIGGTLAEDRCFLPRVHGMARRKKEAIASAERGAK